MATVSLEKLVKRYGSVEVVHGIDLEVADREFIALVGPSGCGKSTTLRMIAGLEPITDGNLRIGGRVVNKEQLAEQLYGWDEEVGPNAIEVYVHRLRKKLEPAGVLLKDRDGNPIACLYKTADSRFDGSTNSGQPVSLSR